MPKQLFSFAILLSLLSLKNWGKEQKIIAYYDLITIQLSAFPL
jgi:hypothetical protein